MFLKCPPQKASLLEQFKEFYPHVTNRTIAIRNGLLVLSATEHEVKFTKGSYNYHLNCSNPGEYSYIVISKYYYCNIV